MNRASFSYFAFSFRVSPAIIAGGMIFSLLMGMIAGLPPAMRALRPRSLRRSGRFEIGAPVHFELPDNLGERMSGPILATISEERIS